MISSHRELAADNVVGRRGSSECEVRVGDHVVRERGTREWDERVGGFRF